MRASVKAFAIFLGWSFLTIMVVILLMSFLKKGIISKKMGINLLVVGDDSIAALVVRPQEGLVTWVNFPTDLKIKVWPGGATYPILSLWKFGQGEKRAFEITEKSVGLMAGVTLPRMVKLSKTANPEGLSTTLLSFGLKTDLSWKDRWELRNYLSEAIVSKRLLEIDAPKLIMDKVEEPDGKEFFVLNAGVFHWVKDKFYFESILGEDAEVSVENLTGRAGEGTQLARQLEAAGMRVVEVIAGDVEESKGKDFCEYFSSGNYPMTEKFLIEQLNCVKLMSMSKPEDKAIKVRVR